VQDLLSELCYRKAFIWIHSEALERTLHLLSKINQTQTEKS